MTSHTPADLACSATETVVSEAAPLDSSMQEGAGLQSGTELLTPGTVQPEVLLQRAAQTFHSIPSILRRRQPGEPDPVQEMHVSVIDWSQVKKRHPGLIRRSMPDLPLEKQKMSKMGKNKGQTTSRTYTSKFRGVHQTFPTKRWEAQFRRNGKPTSLGCFDHEEEAARAYDKMMLWCELHNHTGLKGGVTNFDPIEYEADLSWLQGVTQDELVQALRSDGRRQAAQRMLRQKRDGQLSYDEPTPSQST